MKTGLVQVKGVEYDIRLCKWLCRYVYPIDDREELKKVVAREHERLRWKAKLTEIEGKVTHWRRITCLSKVSAVLKWLKDCPDKVLLLANSMEVINAFREELKKSHRAVALYPGSKPHRVLIHLNKFQDNPRCRLLCMPARAVPTSLEKSLESVDPPGLMPQRIVVVDPDWDPEVNRRAFDLVFEMVKGTTPVTWVSVKTDHWLMEMVKEASGG